MLKKCKCLMTAYCILIIEAWDFIIIQQKQSIPVHWTIAIRKLIPKTDNMNDPSLFRDINLSNIDGKIFFGILSKRANKFMVSNGYIDTSIQKGYIAKIPGVLEHTYHMTEVLRNAREHQRSICVSWLDLKNAFGSVGHNVIDFTLEWYHWPEPVRKVIHSYYKELYVQVQTKQYSTSWIKIEKGIFQGDTLADILFNAPWNLSLDLIKNEGTVGYNHKEAKVKTKMQGYVDDLTVLTQTAKQHQKVLDTLSAFLEWSGMEAKPSKCKSFAQKVFNKDGNNGGFEPYSDKVFSSYDPKLTISEKPIPFLENGSFKMLGKWVNGKSRKKENKSMVKKKLLDYLIKTDKAFLNGVQKAWIYTHMIIPCLTWELTIYELPISFIETLDAEITKYLKKWLGVARCADNTVLYRSKQHFGLQIPNIKTCFKKAQTGREHKMKHSKDNNIRKLHCVKAKSEEEKVRWSACKELNNVERAIILDDMAFSGQTNRHGIGFNKKQKLNPREKIAKKVEELDEVQREQHAVQLGMQGSWTKWDNLMNNDMKWQSLLYSYSPSLLSFALNATQLTLPTPDNLVRWGKTQLGKCDLCKYNKCTLLHILSGCKFSLDDGRFTWRHDSILKIIVDYIYDKIEDVKNKPSHHIDQTLKMINFVKKGERPKKSKANKESILDSASDWEIICDLGSEKMVFPMYITTTSQRPDVVIVSKDTKTVIMVELTSPMEENVEKRNSDKKKKYDDLVFQCKNRNWNAHLMCVEVGARGFLANSINYMVRRLGINTKEARKMKSEISLTALRCSYAIYLQRKAKSFVKWDFR